MIPLRRHPIGATVFDFSKAWRMSSLRPSLGPGKLAAGPDCIGATGVKAPGVPLPGDDTGGATPVPIPNTAVKPAGPMIVPLARKSAIAGLIYLREKTEAPAGITAIPAGASACAESGFGGWVLGVGKVRMGR